MQDSVQMFRHKPVDSDCPLNGLSTHYLVMGGNKSKRLANNQLHQETYD